MELNIKVALVISFIFVVLSFVSTTLITGNFVENERNYTYTKALCAEGFCEDYEIECNSSKLAEFKATGNIIKTPEGWVDFREETLEGDFCK